MERLVRFFNLFDPHVQGIQFFFDQILKIIWSTKNTVNGAHQEGEEGQT